MSDEYKLYFDENKKWVKMPLTPKGYTPRQGEIGEELQELVQEFERLARAVNSTVMHYVSQRILTQRIEVDLGGFFATIQRDVIVNCKNLVTTSIIRRNAPIPFWKLDQVLMEKYGKGFTDESGETHWDDYGVSLQIYRQGLGYRVYNIVLLDVQNSPKRIPG